jgi:hypothetical protein
LAILEGNNFHEETLFAFASVVGDAQTTVFAPEHWRSREFVHEDLHVPCEWRPFQAFDAVEAFDLLLVNTFPSPAGQPAIDGALAAGTAVFGLVHDIDFFAEGGARAALERHERLVLAHVGPSPPAGVDALPATLRRRVVRFFPVVRVEGAAEPGRRSGVALPGALEYARRDFSSALRLAAETGTTLSIFGRSLDQGDGPKRPRDLDADRARLLAEIDARGLRTRVAISTDVTCRDLYRCVGGSRFVAVMTVNPEYLQGKLTGTVTAALSCGVPMLALPPVRAHYAAADPDAFAGCMIAFDPLASDEWARIVRTPDPAYERLCAEAIRARDALLRENAMTIRGLLT